ncbi:unnamed protein product [marine sediment metagenome]|uniref:Uncharacterized protein n=1 Tax=marine sediment metagenome TaxID=412755 RepID=X0TP39_9ZZZZ
MSMTPEEIVTMGNNFAREAREGEPSCADVAAAIMYAAAKICERLDALMEEKKDGAHD